MDNFRVTNMDDMEDIDELNSSSLASLPFFLSFDDFFEADRISELKSFTIPEGYINLWKLDLDFNGELEELSLGEGTYSNIPNLSEEEFPGPNQDFILNVQKVDKLKTLTIADAPDGLVIDADGRIVGETVGQRDQLGLLQRLRRRLGVAPDRRATQVPKVGAPAECGRDVGRERSNVGAARATRRETEDVGLAVDAFDVECGHRDRSWCSFDLFALARQLMQALAVDLDGAHHRRDLLDVAHERLGGAGDIVDRHPRHVMGHGHVAVCVEGVGLDSEHGLGDVGLLEVGDEPKQPRALADPQNEHAGGAGIERSTVADLAGAEYAASLGDDVMARPAGFLVDDDEA